MNIVSIYGTVLKTVEGDSLVGAKLQEANLRDANLQGANLRDANLRDANLQGADLDFSCWPLWCGSLSVEVDARIAKQLLYHALAVGMEHMPEVSDDLISFANEFHRVGEVPKLERRKKV